MLNHYLRVYIYIFIIASSIFITLISNKTMAYTVLLLSSLLVIEGGINHTKRNFTKHLLLMLFAPQIVLFMFFIFTPEENFLYPIFSDFFDTGLSRLFVGVVKTEHSLIADGYSNRVDEMKFYVVICFFVTLLFSRGLLVSLFYVRDTHKQEYIVKYYSNNKTFASRFGGFFPVIALMLWACFFRDMYTPDCTTRCTNIESGAYITIVFFSFSLSVLVICIGLLINSLRCCSDLEKRPRNRYLTTPITSNTDTHV